MSKQARIEKRKKLEALFDQGEYVWFTADNGRFVEHTEDESTEEDMAIWVRPCDPLQREDVVREAQAARARVIVASKDSESNEWLNVRAFIVSMEMDTLVEYVLDLDEGERISEARRTVLKESEWEDFNALRDSMRRYEEAGSPQGDEEWEPLLKRDREFGEQVSEVATELRKSAWDAMHLMPRAELEKRAFTKRSEQSGSTAFMREYEAGMLFYACRDDEDHSELYFDSINDLRAQPQDLQDALAAKLAVFISEAAEAKNSQGAAPSLPSSEPSDDPEISESSGPEESTD